MSAAEAPAPQPAPTAAAPGAKATIPAELGRKVVARYAEVVRAGYAEALREAQVLRASADTLIKTPTPKSLADARAAWQVAKAAYGRTEAFRFYGGPIDDPAAGPEGLLNAWPIDEAYIDYVKGQANAGIINDSKTYPAITKELLVSANEKDGEKNISTGFHAIEFLLWGQDLSVKGPGARPVSDYMPKNKTAARRGEYLRLLTDLVVEQLTTVSAQWQPGVAGNYADTMAKEPLSESLRKIYTGMSSLSVDEMAGERMTVALERNDQEQEQDCFSDFTVAGMRANEDGIQRVYFGRVDGKDADGVRDLIAALDPALAKRTDEQLAAAAQALKDLPAPFDRILAAKKANDPGRRAAKAAVAALEEQGKAIAASGHLMGLILNVQ